jgi:hypothetical protein
MRYEWLVVLSCCLLCAWAFYDEEPILDLTDLSLAQSLCLLLVMAGVL